MPTQIEILREVETLKYLRDRLKVRRSAFGSDHEAAFRVQIEFLEGTFNDDDLNEEFDPENDTDVFSAYYRAVDWMEGIEDPPSRDWLEDEHLFNPKE